MVKDFFGIIKRTAESLGGQQINSTKIPNFIDPRITIIASK